MMRERCETVEDVKNTIEQELDDCIGCEFEVERYGDSIEITIKD